MMDERGGSTSWYINPSAKPFDCSVVTHERSDAIQTFHETLPFYAPTPLISFPSIAKELGVSNVLIKDESLRFGLPSFKILGASWAVSTAVAAKVGLEVSKSSLSELGDAARKQGIRLVSCSAGNWGRAVARMAKYLSIPAKIFLPEDIDEETREKIVGEGADCLMNPGDYDDAIQRAIQEENNVAGSLLVMDTSWPGYEDIPLLDYQWVTEGYQTLLMETERQINHLLHKESKVTHAICPVGVGSWAHAVVMHFRSTHTKSPGASIIAVEPAAAASLQNSLRHEEVTPTLSSTFTIMAGMNCRTISTVAWPVLRDGVNVSISVTDEEAHQALLQLGAADGLGVDVSLDSTVRNCKVRTALAAFLSPFWAIFSGKLFLTSPSPGPCGAAPLAALKKAIEHEAAGFDPVTLEDATILMFCTEGFRDYPIPQERSHN